MRKLFLIALLSVIWINVYSGSYGRLRYKANELKRVEPNLIEFVDAEDGQRRIITGGVVVIRFEEE